MAILNHISEKQIFWNDLKSGHFLSMVKESAKGESLSYSKEVFNIMRPLMAEHEDVEALYCIFLNAKNRVISIDKMFSGTIEEAAVYPREIIKRLLSQKASAMIISHNHPSGTPDPSPQDFIITKKVLIALHCVGATLHEHLIVGNSRYYSFADSGEIAKIKRDVSMFLSTYVNN